MPGGNVDIFSILWLIAIILLFVVEGTTYALVCIWFAGGAIFALIFSLLGFNVIVQMVVFLIVSGTMLVLLRPAAKRLLNRRKVHTNADRVIGQEGVVLERIEPINGLGQVKVMGQVWSARPEDGASIIERDSRVEVVGISGVKVTVREKARWQ